MKVKLEMMAEDMVMDDKFTVMEIKIEGIEKGEKVRHTYYLLDHFDPETGLSSMARTTGFTCASAARLVLEEIFSENGVFPPEKIGARSNCYTFILDNLAKHKVTFKHTKTLI